MLKLGIKKASDEEKTTKSRFAYGLLALAGLKITVIGIIMTIWTKECLTEVNKLEFANRSGFASLDSWELSSLGAQIPWRVAAQKIRAFFTA